jgi:hypothetical protein
MNKTCKFAVPVSIQTAAEAISVVPWKHGLEEKREAVAA